jgi:hypothetical protein
LKLFLTFASQNCPSIAFPPFLRGRERERERGIVRQFAKTIKTPLIDAATMTAAVKDFQKSQICSH